MNLKNRAEVWILCLKSIVLAYCLLLYVDSAQNPQNTGLVVLFILAYITLNISAFLSAKKRLKMSLYILSAILIISCYAFLCAFFVLLLPINIIDMFGKKVRMFTADLIILSSALIINTKAFSILGIYLLTMLVSIAYYRVIYYSIERIEALTEENASLKEKNYGLKTGIEKKQKFEEQIMYTSKLEERNKITQEMHDKLGHTISASLLQLEASKMLIGKDNDKASRIVQTSIDYLRDGMDVIRNILKGIKPSANEIGINKIKLMLDKFESRNAMSVNLVYSGDVERIDYGLWNIIYENTNEALTNILKYSKANRVTVNIEVLNKIVKAEVRDNGVGARNIVKGLGLSGMEERTQNAGGEIIIDGENGFSVITLLPV